MPIKCVQLNCHKSKAVTANLRNDLLIGIDVAMLQEPHTYKNTITGLGNSNVMHGADPGSRPRAALVASNHANIWFEKEFSDRDTAVAIIKDGNTEVYLASVYLDIQNPLNDMIQKKVLNLIQYCKQHNKKLIIGCDTNCHSVLFGTETNNRGAILEELIVTQGLSILNVGLDPTFVSRGTQSIVDATFALNVEADKITMSDHNMICFDIPSLDRSIKRAPNYKKTDWTKFTHLTEEFDLIEPLVITQEWLNEECDDIISLITKALDKSTPTIKVGGRNKPQQFWSQDVQTQKASVRSAYRLYKRDGLLSSWDNYINEKRTFKRELRKAKADNWRKHTAGCEGPADLAKLFRSMQKRQNKQLEILATRNRTPAESVDLLMRTHYPGCTTDTEERIPSHESRAFPMEQELSYITPSKTRWSINSVSYTHLTLPTTPYV